MSQAEHGARSFGAHADAYHLARPGYPDAAVDWALDGNLDPREYDPDVELDRRWFGPTRRRHVGSELVMTVDDFLGPLGSRSYLLTAAPEQRAEILAWTRAAAEAHACDGRLAVPFRTTLLTARAVSTGLKAG